MSMNNNKNDRYFDDSKNKGDSRKILQAKRHGSSRLNRHINQPTTSYHASTSQGVKRTQSTDNAEQPPNKKLYLDYTPQRMSHAPVPQSTKNLASRRMENLRKSLEQQKKDGIKKTPDSTVKNTPKTPVSNVNERLKPSGSRYSATPNYKSDGHFKRSSKRDSDDETSPDDFSAVKSSSVQNRLKSCKSFERCADFKSNLSSKFLQSPVCSTTSCSDMVKSDLESSVNCSVLNNNVQLSNSPVKLYSQTSTDSNDTMEWSAIDEETILENINELRKEINYKLPLNNIPNLCNTLTSAPQNDSAHIVVDTNIFLSQLSFVSRLRDTHFTGFGRPVIVVPWMVIQELDYMKDSNHHRSLRKTAQKAVHYINGQLASKHPQFKGQTVLEASTQDLSSINPDDGILFCCMQLAQQGKKVILLSNDVNLRSKALVNNVQAYSNNDITDNLNNMHTSVHTPNDTRPVQKIKILISNLLTYIIEHEMKDAFGDLWLRMAMMHPPFTTEEALICMDKYWISVFSFSLQKQCKQKIEEFIVFMKNHRHGDNYQTADFNKFVEYTLSLCIYLKNGYKKYKEKVTECIFNIQKCAE